MESDPEHLSCWLRSMRLFFWRIRMLVYFRGLPGFVTGCVAHRQDRAAPLEAAAGVAAARPPRFLTGPVSVLLTNRDDFSARIVIIETNREVTISSGNLFQKEGLLLFVPRSDY